MVKHWQYLLKNINDKLRFSWKRESVICMGEQSWVFRGETEDVIGIPLTEYFRFCHPVTLWDNTLNLGETMWLVLSNDLYTEVTCIMSSQAFKCFSEFSFHCVEIPGNTQNISYSEAWLTKWLQWALQIFNGHEPQAWATNKP